MEKRPEVPLNCYFQGSYNPLFDAEIEKAKALCFQYNQLSPNEKDAQRVILNKLLGKMGKEVIVTPPFWCDYGYNISVGDYFYSNHNLIITDGAKVTFGDHVFIAPNCCFTTAEHARPGNAQSGHGSGKADYGRQQRLDWRGVNDFGRRDDWLGQRYRRGQCGQKVNPGKRGCGRRSL